MSLRRFPWKLPRLTDVSYKYFVAEPTPGCPSLEDLRTGGGHRHHHNSTDASSMSTTSTDRPETPQGQAAQPTASVKGPWRLLRLLPRESRYIIGRMLDTNPETRATMGEVFDDPWFMERECCRQDETGRVFRVPGHDHVLEPTAPG